MKYSSLEKRLNQLAPPEEIVIWWQGYEGENQEPPSNNNIPWIVVDWGDHNETI